MTCPDDLSFSGCTTRAEALAHADEWVSQHYAAQRRAYMVALFDDIEQIEDVASTLAAVDLQFLKIEAEARAVLHDRIVGRLFA